MPAGGLLVSVSAWVHSQSGDMRMAVYADDAGEPGDLLGEAAGKSVTGTGHFEEFELLAPVAVSESDLVRICVLASPEIYRCDAGAPVQSLARRILARTYRARLPRSVRLGELLLGQPINARQDLDQPAVMADPRSTGSRPSRGGPPYSASTAEVEVSQRRKTSTATSRSSCASPHPGPPPWCGAGMPIR